MRNLWRTPRSWNVFPVVSAVVCEHQRYIEIICLAVKCTIMSEMVEQFRAYRAKMNEKILAAELMEQI